VAKRSYTKADRIHALKVVELCDGNLSAASRETKIPRKTLESWVAESKSDALADDSPLADDLTLKQARFADEYVKTGNATESARRAGYDGTEGSLRAIGHENLTKPHILQRIQKRIFSASSLTKNEIVGTLAEHMRGDVNDLLSESGFISLDKARENGVTHLIKKLKYGEFGLAEVEFHSPQAAAAQLSKILGIEHGKDITININPERRRQVRVLAGIVKTTLDEGRSTVEQIWDYVAQRVHQLYDEDVSELRDEVLELVSGKPIEIEARTVGDG